MHDFMLTDHLSTSVPNCRRWSRVNQCIAERNCVEEVCEAACRNASESSGDEGTAAPTFISKAAISAAPAVDTSGLILADDGEPVSAAAAAAEVAANIGTRTLQYNPTLDELQVTQGGPNASATAASLRNHRSGFVEDMAVPGAVFDMQYNDFNSKGVAEAPDRRMFGDLSAGPPHLSRYSTATHPILMHEVAVPADDCFCYTCCCCRCTSGDLTTHESTGSWGYQSAYTQLQFAIIGRS